MNTLAALNKILKAPKEYRLTQAQIDLAWQYAYYFFFEFPQTFPMASGQGLG